MNSACASRVASSRTIVAAVVGGALRLVGSGLLLGVVAAIALARVMMAALDFVEPADVSTYAGVAVMLLAATGGAAFSPARRAMRVDPVRTLRSN